MLAGCAGAAEWAGCYAEAPLLFEPGTSWHYSVPSDLLGWIAEVASGRRLDAFCRKENLRPTADARQLLARGLGA